MNTLTLPSTFIIKHQNLSWDDLGFALQNEIVSGKTIVDYAMMKVSSSKYTDDDFELAACNPDDTHLVTDKLRFLLSDTNDIEKTTKKWLYLCLLYLYKNKVNFDDPLQVIESIYSDFNYPEEIKHLIRYMPNNDGRIVDFDKEWKLFLDTNLNILK